MEGNIKIRPLFDNVVIKEDEVEEKTKTGIIVGQDENPALVGVVVAVGKDIEEQIKIGDRIMYAPFSGRELGGFLILPQHDIMGIVEEEGDVNCNVCGKKVTKEEAESNKHLCSDLGK